MERFRLQIASLLTISCLSLPGCDAIEGGGGDSGADSGSEPTTTSGGATGAPAGPTEAEIDRCRDQCDRLQFFDCIGSDLHAACWGYCADRPSDDLELFAACVGNTVPECDPGCLERLGDASPPPEPEPEDPATCAEACNDFNLECPSEESPDCAGLCAQLPASAHDFAVDCFEEATLTCSVPEGCEIEGGEGEGGGEEGGAEG